LLLIGIYLVFQLQSCVQDFGLSQSVGRLLAPKKVEIGLVAGHGGNDSGAVCPDGLQEATINRDVAERTASLLRRAGFRVELLQEFDPRLQGYEAMAFVAIHSDSCLNNVSGFKVARFAGSQAPAESDRLVDSLYQEYAATTGLQPHTDTITQDMREYHAFRAISPSTPAAIIEVGFMGGDRNLLTRRPDLVARGIARGIAVFLNNQAAER